MVLDRRKQDSVAVWLLVGKGGADAAYCAAEEREVSMPTLFDLDGFDQELALENAE